jgi:DNA-binding response OmpR family regulator
MMKPTLLIVDDNEMMRTFLSFYLGDFFEAHEFNSAEDARDWLGDGNKPDLILADLHMPGLSGLEFLNLLKSRPAWNPIPVIMVSGEENTDEKIKCLEAGAADYIVKPFNPKELELRINKLLNLKISQ